MSDDEEESPVSGSNRRRASLADRNQKRRHTLDDSSDEEEGLFDDDGDESGDPGAHTETTQTVEYSADRMKEALVGNMSDIGLEGRLSLYSYCWRLI